MLNAINTEDRTDWSLWPERYRRFGNLWTSIVERVPLGGRVFYLGAGTSGRLGIVDASEIPPTYGVHDVFIGFMAGGDSAIRDAVEGAEDDVEGGWRDLPGIFTDKE